VRISCVDICRRNFPLSAKGRGDADQREVSVGKALLSGAVKWATYMARMAQKNAECGSDNQSRFRKSNELVCTF
jgi:hypothetical protein